MESLEEGHGVARVDDDGRVRGEAELRARGGRGGRARRSPRAARAAAARAAARVQADAEVPRRFVTVRVRLALRANHEFLGYFCSPPAAPLPHRAGSAGLEGGCDEAAPFPDWLPSRPVGRSRRGLNQPPGQKSRAVR